MKIDELVKEYAPVIIKYERIILDLDEKIKSLPKSANVMIPSSDLKSIFKLLQESTIITRNLLNGVMDCLNENKDENI